MKKVIAENEDPAVKDQSLILRFGSNSDQIQVSRILMSYLFMKLTDTFGNVPYWSYGQRDNPDFQALRLGDRGKRIPNPKYTDAQVIYRDMLAELKDAADKLTHGKFTFSFIRSQFEGWSQTHYEKGVKAAMSFWGVSPAEIDEYVKQLPPASRETVLTQKYIGLFMDGLEGWTLYRSTGYPKTLNIPRVAQMA